MKYICISIFTFPVPIPIQCIMKFTINSSYYNKRRVLCTKQEVLPFPKHVVFLPVFALSDVFSGCLLNRL